MEPSILLRNSCDHNWPSAATPEDDEDLEWSCDTPDDQDNVNASDENYSDFEHEELSDDDHVEADEFECEEYMSSSSNENMTRPTKRPRRPVVDFHWTKDHDRIVLVAAKAHGPNVTTWQAVINHAQLKSHEVSIEAVRSRYQELIAFLRRHD